MAFFDKFVFFIFSGTAVFHERAAPRGQKTCFSWRFKRFSTPEFSGNIGRIFGHDIVDSDFKEKQGIFVHFLFLEIFGQHSRIFRAT